MEAFREAILKITKEHSLNITAQITAGVVVSVSNNNTCKVERENLPPLEDVRLNAVEGNFDNLFLIIPRIGSQVLCATIEGNSEETTIVKYTEIDKVIITIGGAKFEMSGGKFDFKNENADLKQNNNDLLDALKNAKILTPNGVGRFAKSTKMKLDKIKEKNNELFR
ncbi:hypothetical protein [Riemerella anatipestifer]|uniref:Uncharacterized protein n=1 Tax=Riemerella anatipestifer TaxID=34085 RepID=A0A1S7DV14_RIEAN|nr:hypothetical protein [Riemerella anatipestifer]AQY22972.1 hypothetical protein AB406_2032 [Riemerella anatipestifer]MBT0550390.1 hypothetical protein [Riemerella anatipestifer]MBT0556850.1 hypothetical protein [Riemerella anatipestifer]MBT0561160.1 hypothetical protein [Riemerella anatipestifer]MCO7355773.1 hypothetical protein [Riemerella anatipestifer]